MDFIKYLDFFSIKFNFYTNNQPNYQNIFGGIMTFLYLIICIIIFITISYDDLMKLNPITTMSEIPDSERKIVNMNKEKIWIPFRMVNYENQFVDPRGILYIVPYSIEGKYNEKIGMDLKYNLLNYKLCNETSMVNKPDKYKIDVPLDQLFCFDKDEIPFGGNWNHDFLYYLEINLYLCEEGISYNSSDPRCSKIDKFLKDLNSSLIMDFYYPIVQFQPTNLDTPIQIIYKNYYYRLTSYSYKVEKLFIREHILSDDNNIIKSNYKNISCWGTSSLYSDDYFLPSSYDPISNNSNNSRIYALNIYMDDGLVYYSRTFKKAFLIVSDIFPIIRLILYFVKRITQHIKMSLIKRKLTGLIFENKKIKPRKLFSKRIEDFKRNSNMPRSRLLLISNKSELELMKDKNLNINNNSNNLNDINNNRNITVIRNNNINNSQNENNINEQLENNNSSSIYYNTNLLSRKLNRTLNDESPNKSLNKNRFSFIHTKNSKNKSTSFLTGLKLRSSHKKNNIKNKKKRRKKYLFPYYYFFLDIFFDKLIYPQKFFCISKSYFTVYNFMCQIYDISTHIILFKQFNLLNNMVKERLNEENVFCPSALVKRINLSDKNIVDKLNKDLKNKKSIIYTSSLLQ